MMTRRLTIWFACSALLLAGCAAGKPDRTSRPARVVRVKLVADPVLRRYEPLWRDTARDLLRTVSDYYEKRFGIRLALQALEAWHVEGSTASSVKLMKRLKASYPKAGGALPHDVVIGLTQQPLNFYRGGRARADRFGNCAEGLGNYIVSHVGESYTYGDELTEDVLALVHEMGHLLGAVHTDDPESVMHVDFGSATGFDAANRAIVMRNRLCPFAEPQKAAEGRGRQPGSGP